MAPHEERVVTKSYAMMLDQNLLDGAFLKDFFCRKNNWKGGRLGPSFYKLKSSKKRLYQIVNKKHLVCVVVLY